jgi:hypothetical protein
MKIREMILRAIEGRLKWYQAAENSPLKYQRLIKFAVQIIATLPPVRFLE